MALHEADGETVKRVLMVAYYFPPVAASGAMRPLGFCRNLVAYGWQPQVLTTTPECVYPLHQVDPKLGERVPAGVEVIRVPYVDRLQQVLQCREMLRGIVRRSTPHESERKTGAALMPSDSSPGRSTLKDFILDWAFAFPDRQCGWMRQAVRKLRALPEKDVPDVIFATGGPWTNFLIGNTLAEYFHRPLVLDYRDPWNCNPYYSFNSDTLTRKSRATEAQVCQSASHVIANTEELRERLIDDYECLRDRCTWIPNGFDRETLTPAQVSQNQSDYCPTSSGYELCHFGTVYGKRTPRILLQAVWELFQEHQLKPEAIRLRFVGGWDTTDPECEHYAVNLEKHGFLRREPPVSHSVCLREMQRSSVLLVLQPDSPLQVPAKIYEYVATGRPLLLIGGEGATANLVARHGLGVSSPNHIARIKALLKDVTAGTQKLVPPDGARVNRFEYQSLTGELAAILDAAVRARPVR
ncbi:MAG: Putative Glycosyl transferase [Nitrospira sp.]|nr:MAG: Putative Glycosyl transferase [Nitrospira sp.]